MDLKNTLPAGTHLQSLTDTYTIQNVLGAGGFGITYRATTVIMNKNIRGTMTVAIKEHFPAADCERDVTTSQLTYSSTASERVERSRQEFIDEAKCLQRIAGLHPNIVTVNEVFEANNTAYYVMEYLEGQSLKEYVADRGKLSVRETLTLMMPVVEAVATLYRNKFTHLDIKPSNIMLTEDENGGIRPVLIDFGLARHYNPDGSATATVQSSGFSEGYAPVEQYSGITTFSPAVDVYAIGATILYCLTGKTPPRSASLDANTLASIIPATVPEKLRRLLMFSMAFQASERIPNARQLYLELKNVCQESGIDHAPANVAADDSTRRMDQPRSNPAAGAAAAAAAAMDDDPTIRSDSFRHQDEGPTRLGNPYSGGYAGPTSNPYQQPSYGPTSSPYQQPPYGPTSSPYQQPPYGPTSNQGQWQQPGGGGQNVPPVAPQPKPSTPVWIWVTIALLVVALAVAATLLLTNKDNDRRTPAPATADTVIEDDAVVEETLDSTAEPWRETPTEEPEITYVSKGSRTPDLGFHDLTGPVKSIKNQWGAAVPFSADGKWTGTWHDNLGARTFIRDEMGRIVTEHYSRSDYGPGEKVYTWDGNHVTSSVDNNLNEQVYYTYDSNGDMETMSIYKDNKQTVYQFYNIRHDKNGNWISRSFNRTTDDGYSRKSSSGTQKRSITYYK